MQTRRWLLVTIASWGACAVSAASSPPSSKVVLTRTLHEGEVPYARHDVRTWVRAGPKAQEVMASDRQFGEKLLGPFRETDNVRALRTAIGLHLAEHPKPEDVWEGARHILQWLDKHGRHNNGAYEQMMGRDWPSVERIADYYAQHHKLPWAACFSQAHLNFQLFRLCGLPLDDIGIATARYEGKGDERPSHVYLGLRVGGEWYYIDPGRGKDVPPYAKRASLGRRDGGTATCDYAHPFSFKTAAQAKFKAIPLLQSAVPPDVK